MIFSTEYKLKTDGVDELTYQNHIQTKCDARTEKNKKKDAASEKNIVVTMDFRNININLFIIK